MCYCWIPFRLLLKEFSLLPLNNGEIYIKGTQANCFPFSFSLIRDIELAEWTHPWMNFFTADWLTVKFCRVCLSIVFLNGNITDHDYDEEVFEVIYTV